jgi:hypothetical protein
MSACHENGSVSTSVTGTGNFVSAHQREQVIPSQFRDHSSEDREPSAQRFVPTRVAESSLLFNTLPGVSDRSRRHNQNEVSHSHKHLTGKQYLTERSNLSSQDGVVRKASNSDLKEQFVTQPRNTSIFEFSPLADLHPEQGKQTCLTIHFQTSRCPDEYD